jgi:hypothetical protein
VSSDPAALSRAVDRHDYRIGSLERSRVEIGKRVREVEGRVDGIDRAMEVARAVAKAEATKVARSRSSRYSRGELAVGSIVAASAVGGLILQLAAHT